MLPGQHRHSPSVTVVATSRSGHKGRGAFACDTLAVRADRSHVGLYLEPVPCPNLDTAGAVEVHDVLS